MLTTRVGNVQLRTPLILGSGHITETPDFFLQALKFGCASMVTRSLREQVPTERSRIPAPRYHIIDGASMLNCEWTNANPWTDWKTWVKTIKETGSPLILSLSGRNLESCINLIRSFDEIGVDAFEINLSCSHSGALHGNLNVDQKWLKKLLRAIRPLTATPLWIKLSYSPMVVLMATEAENMGADAIVCSNTIGPGLILNTATGKPVLGIQGGAGGLSGKAIFPIALRCVFEISQAIKIPVVGVGGISSADNVLQMLMAGASAVQLYTLPALRGPHVFEPIIRDLNKYLSNHPNLMKLTDLVGSSHKWASAGHCFESEQPVWEDTLCNRCRKCLDACQFGALSFAPTNRSRSCKIKLVIDSEKCVSCSACTGICPQHAISPPKEG